MYEEREREKERERERGERDNLVIVRGEKSAAFLV